MSQPLKRLLTDRIVSITELREPGKVLEKANGKPVAILKNNECVGYLVPSEATDSINVSYVERSDLIAAFEATKDRMQPVMDYLKDK